MPLAIRKNNAKAGVPCLGPAKLYAGTEDKEGKNRSVVRAESLILKCMSGPYDPDARPTTRRPRNPPPLRCFRPPGAVAARREKGGPTRSPPFIPALSFESQRNLWLEAPNFEQ